MTRSQSEEGDSFLEILNESELGTFNCHISEICNDCANCPFESQRARPLNPSRTICGMFTRWNDSRRNSDADLCWDLMVTGPVLAFFLKPTKGTLEFDHRIIPDLHAIAPGTFFYRKRRGLGGASG